MVDKQIIRKLILQTIEENSGYCDWKVIRSKVRAYHFNKQIEIPTDIQITHEAALLEEDDAIKKNVELHLASISYRITAWGHAMLKPFYKKFLYFVIFKNSNSISFIALILSIIALILSDRVWSWL
jgi:hypothetical protein